MINLKKNKLFNKLTNAFLYFGSSFVVLLFSLFTFPIYSTYLSASDFGLIGYFTSLKSLIAPLCNLSLSNYFLMKFFKEKKEQNEESLFNILFYLSINNVIVTVISLFIGYYYFNLTEVSYPFYPFFILILGIAYFEPYKMFLLQQYRIRKEGWSFFIFSSLAPILNATFSLSLLIIFNLGVFGRMLGMTLSMILLGFLSIIFLKRFVKPNYSFNDFKDKIISIFPLVFASYAYIPIETFDRIFLEKLKMPETLGLYSIGLQISGYFLLASTALFKAFEPNIFQAIINNNRFQLKKEIIQYYSILIIGFSIFFLLLDPIIDILTKSKFIDAVYYAKYLSIARLLTAASLLFGAIILAKQKPNQTAFIIYIASFFSIILYPLTIKLYLFEGAMLTRVIIPSIIIIISLIIIKWFSVVDIKENNKL